jgi:hypothetical protein
MTPKMILFASATIFGLMSIGIMVVAIAIFREGYFLLFDPGVVGGNTDVPMGGGLFGVFILMPVGVIGCLLGIGALFNSIGLFKRQKSSIGFSYLVMIVWFLLNGLVLKIGFSHKDYWAIAGSALAIVAAIAATACLWFTPVRKLFEEPEVD